MTLIFGINLSDRVYVASDTRVTYSNPQGNYYKDCICKNVPLNGELIVSAAGNTKFATYLFEGLRKASFINRGINVVKQELESWARKIIGEYYLKGNPYTTACLIIAGIDKSKRKRIFGKKYLDLVSEYQALIKDKNNPLAMKDAVFKGISAKPNQQNPYPELPVADSTVISLQSDIAKGFFQIDEAEFGSYLAYGPNGYRKDDVPKFLFGKLEFEEGNMFRDMSLLTAFITSTAEEKRFGTVGGSVVVDSVDENQGILRPAGTVHKFNPAKGQEYVVSKTEFIDGKFYGKTESGIMVRLINFNKYKSEQSKYFL